MDTSFTYDIANEKQKLAPAQEQKILEMAEFLKGRIKGQE